MVKLLFTTAVLPETELMLLPLQYEKAPKTNEMPPPYAFAP
jgi:hypothetical protein